MTQRYGIAKKPSTATYLGAGPFGTVICHHSHSIRGRLPAEPTVGDGATGSRHGIMAMCIQPCHRRALAVRNERRDEAAKCLIARGESSSLGSMIGGAFGDPDNSSSGARAEIRRVVRPPFLSQTQSV